MLKGINKRIIEINRTNNDYFERAILFVRSDKMDLKKRILSKEANNYIKNLPNDKNKYALGCKIVIAILGAILVALIAAYLYLEFFN